MAKELFLVQYRDGGHKLEYLSTIRNGAIGKKDRESLTYRGYIGWVNVKWWLNNTNEGKEAKKEMLKEHKLVIETKPNYADNPLTNPELAGHKPIKVVKCD